MTVSEIHQRLKDALGDAVGALSEPKVDAFCVVRADQLVEVCRFLRGTIGIELDHCNVITGVDYPKRNVIEVVYHLASYRHRHGIVLKVEADRAAPDGFTEESPLSAASHRGGAERWTDPATSS